MVQTRLTLTFHHCSVVAELISLPEINQKYGQGWTTESIAMFFFSLRSFLAEYLSLYELLIPSPFLPLTYCTFS